MRKKRIGIINCGRRKVSQYEKMKAEDMYAGNYFNLNMRYMKEIVKPDQILILTLHIPLYSTKIPLTKARAIGDNANPYPYRVLIDSQEEIYPYESGQHTQWGTPAIRKVYDYGIPKYIKDNNIDVNNVEIISLVGEKDHAYAIDPYFPHNERLFVGIGKMGHRLGILSSELKKLEEVK